MDNYTEICQRMANDLRQFIDNKIKNIKTDHSFKAQVIVKISKGKYKVRYKNTERTVRGAVTTNIGDWVYVCAG